MYEDKNIVLAYNERHDTAIFGIKIEDRIVAAGLIE